MSPKVRENRSDVDISDVELNLDWVRDLVQRRKTPDIADIYFAVDQLVYAGLILLGSIDLDENGDRTLRQLLEFAKTHEQNTKRRIRQRLEMKVPKLSTLEKLVVLGDIPDLTLTAHHNFIFRMGEFAHGDDGIFENENLAEDLLSHDVIFSQWNPLLLLRVTKAVVIGPGEDIWFMGMMEWKTIYAPERSQTGLVSETFELGKERKVYIRCQRVPAPSGGYYYTSSVYAEKEQQ